MRGTGWRMLWLGVALIGLMGCVTTPPNPRPPPRPDEFVAPPNGDPRVEDPRAAYPRETMDRTDGKPRGEPVVSNGLALCKLHHAAFDANIIGIRPDYIVEVKRDVLDETDGPMLLHGLQGVHHSRIWTPR